MRFLPIVITALAVVPGFAQTEERGAGQPHVARGGEGTHRGGLTRTKDKPEGRYSPTGIYGDATLATREKGRVVAEAMVSGMLREIEELRKAAIPQRR